MIKRWFLQLLDILIAASFILAQEEPKKIKLKKEAENKNLQLSIWRTKYLSSIFCYQRRYLQFGHETNLRSFLDNLIQSIHIR